MAINFICDTEKYTFNDVSKTISLPIKSFELPKEFLIENNLLSLKLSFHVTLVPIGRIVLKHKIDIPNIYELVLKDFCEFTNNNDINFETFSNDFKFCVEEDKKSIVVMCKVSNLDKFFEMINKKYELNIECPPAHVTLYTIEFKKGIFLIDQEDIKNLTTSIDNPIGRSL